MIFFYVLKALKVFLNKSVKARPFNQLLCVHGKQDEDQEGSHFVVSLHSVHGRRPYCRKSDTFFALEIIHPYIVSKMKLKKEAILLTLTVHDKLAATTVDSHFV